MIRKINESHILFHVPMKHCTLATTIYSGPCEIDVTALADIFTVGRANIFRQKTKISAQTDKPVWRYTGQNY